MKIPRYFPFNEIISNHFKLYSSGCACFSTHSLLPSSTLSFFAPIIFALIYLFIQCIYILNCRCTYTSQIDSKIVVLYEIALISCRIHRFFDSTFVLSEHLKYSNIFPKCYYMHTCIHAYDVIGKLERCIKFKSQCRIYS